MEWLNEDLKNEIKRIFEPRYKRTLTEEEILVIASNLVSYMEHYAKFIWRINNAKN
jgi:hypothetical protein